MKNQESVGKDKDIKNIGVLEKIRKGIRGKLGALAATVVLSSGLMGCSAEEAHTSTTPFKDLDTTTLSKDDARQLMLARAYLHQAEQFIEDGGQFNVYNIGTFKEKVGGIGYGSGWKQYLADILDGTAGDQEKVTKAGALDELDTLIEEYALGLVAKGNTEAAVEIVEKGVDDAGNITKKSVLQELASYQQSLRP